MVKRTYDEKIFDELREMLPKARKIMNKEEKKKELVTLDQWEAKYDDNDWMKLAQQNKTLWNITRNIKESSDMSWKIAVNGAFVVLSGATERHTYIDLDQEELRLSLWTIVIGYSGISRKSTTRRAIRNFLRQIETLDFIPAKMTPEALYEELRKTSIGKDSNAQILGDEMGGFFKSLKKKYMEEMPDILSSLYDCDEIMERSTKSGGRVTVRNPYLRIYGGATISVIKHLVDEYFEQGFLPRFLFIIDLDLDNKKIRPISKRNPYRTKETLKISKEIQKIGKLKVRKLLYEDVPQEYLDFEKYCAEKSLIHARRGDEITSPYYSRLSFHALKLAGLLYLSDLAAGDGTDYPAVPLPAEYIQLGTFFMRLYEQEYLQLIYRYKSSAPAGRFETQERKHAQVENLLKLSGGVCARSKLLRDTKMDSHKFDPVLTTLTETETIRQTQISDKLLIEFKFKKSKGDKNPFMGRPPLLIWHIETFKNNKKDAISYWIRNQPEN